MKAIISSYGGPEVLTVTELPDPVPAADEVLIAVRAFGLTTPRRTCAAEPWAR